MTQGERESVFPAPAADTESNSLLFFDDEPAELRTGEFGPFDLQRYDRARGEQSRRRRRRRRGRLIVALTVIIVAVVARVVVPRVIDYFSVADYAGSGQGSVQISIPSGASAGDIAVILKDKGVVKSTEAFTDAASDNATSQSIQPGVYNLSRHMSGKAALGALLDPASRDTDDDVLVPEGATTLAVAASLRKLYGSSAGAAIDKALRSTADLGVPVTYKVGSRFPSSLEGFEFPATYTIDPGTTPSEALQQMVSRFIQQDRATAFATQAPKATGLTPYEALIVASIAQSEAKYPADMSKVVRTILNRLKDKRPLQFDSTSSYACKLKNQTRCIYDQIVSPYNTYQNKGLPPTPIDNPGAEAMRAAVHPAAGNWLYFVNQDKAGHLFFTNSALAFKAAAAKCAKNNWGCAG